jgi:hypothetical protein
MALDVHLSRKINSFNCYKEKWFLIENCQRTKHAHSRPSVTRDFPICFVPFYEQLLIQTYGPNTSTHKEL